MGALDGRRALLIGFANERALALASALVEAGCDLAAAAASMDGDEVMAAKRAARRAEAAGRRAFSQAWDVTLPTNVQVSLKQLIKEWGHPDILVYQPSAALERPFERTTDAELARVHQTLLLGAFYATRSFVRELPAARSADVVYLIERAQSAAVAAALAGVRGLGAALERELAPRGVRVHVVDAGEPPEALAARVVSLIAGR